MAESLLLDQVISLTEYLPEPCPDLGWEDGDLARIKSKYLQGGSNPPPAKKVKIRRNPVKNNTDLGTQSLVHTPTQTNSVLMAAASSGSNTSSPDNNASPNNIEKNIFDERDEGSLFKEKAGGNAKKRSGPQGGKRLGEEDDNGDHHNDDDSSSNPNTPTSGPTKGKHTSSTSSSSSLNGRTLSEKSNGTGHQAASDGRSNKKAKRSWPSHSLVPRPDLNTSIDHIQNLVSKNRALKKTTDADFKKAPKDFSTIDNYLLASIGFFEAAALYEMRLRTDSSNPHTDTSNAIDLYKGLVVAPLSDVPSLLTYYVSRCEQAKLPLRCIIGQRCLAMAHCRLWSLRQKNLSSNYYSTLKRAPTQEDTVKVNKNLLMEFNDIFRFGDYHSKAEAAASKFPDIFSPIPSHPFDLDPFDFLDFIRQEHKAVEAAESTDQDKPKPSSASSKPATNKKR